MTVSPVVVVGTVVESVVNGKGASAGTVPVVRLAAVVIGCLSVLAADTAVVDFARVVDGGPVVAVLLVDGMTVSAVVFAGTGTSEGDVAEETLDVIDAVVEVVVDDVALVDSTCGVVGPSRRAVVASVETVVCLGDHDGDGVVVALVKVSTRPDTGCVVSVTGSTTTGLMVVGAGGGLWETVVTVVSATLNTGGGVTNFLVVVAGTSAVETAAGG